MDAGIGLGEILVIIFALFIIIPKDVPRILKVISVLKERFSDFLTNTLPPPEEEPDDIYESEEFGEEDDDQLDDPIDEYGYDADFGDTDVTIPVNDSSEQKEKVDDLDSSFDFDLPEDF